MSETQSTATQHGKTVKTACIYQTSEPLPNQNGARKVPRIEIPHKNIVTPKNIHDSEMQVVLHVNSYVNQKVSCSHFLIVHESPVFV